MKKYFRTKHEKDSARITTLIAILIILLVFIVGPKYFDPPQEYGIAVNFGTTDFGSGQVQPKKPVKSEPLNINEKPNVQESQPQASQPQQNNEDVLTEDNAEEIAMKKKKEAEARKKAEAEAKAKAERERVEREKREREAKKKNLDDLIGGIGKSDGSESGSEGNDDRTGDKGQIDGDPYKPYTGIPGSGNGGVGFGLNGRGTPKFNMYEGCENEYGKIVVDIVVDRSGSVVKATPGVKGSNNATVCLKEQAKKIAMSYKWPQDRNAPQRQFVKIVVNFTPN